MSNMVDVLCEAGTACPSRAYGLTPGFFGGSVLLIILVFCVVLVWFVSVLCLVPTISVSVLCLVPTISVSFPLSVSLFCVSFPLSVSLFCVSFPLSVSLFCVSFPLSVSLNCHISRGQRPREMWLFREWTNFHISLMQQKWMFYSTRPTFWWILPNEIFWPSLFTKLLFRNISGVIFTYMENRYMTKALNLENFE
jgi:hypothetical protein